MRSRLILIQANIDRHRAIEYVVELIERMDVKRRTARIWLNLSEVDSYICRFRFSIGKELNGEFVSTEGRAVNFSDETSGFRNGAGSSRLHDRLEWGGGSDYFEVNLSFISRIPVTMWSALGYGDERIRAYGKLFSPELDPDASRNYEIESISRMSMQFRSTPPGSRASKLHNSCRSRSLGSRESRYASLREISTNRLE